MGFNDFDTSAISQVMEGKLYFAVLHRQNAVKASWLPCPAVCFSIDKELVYFIRILIYVLYLIVIVI